VDDRLYRSRTDSSISGVAGGLAAYLGVDPTLVRVAWVLLAIMSGGVFVLIYIVMAIVVPEAPDGWAPRGIIGGGAPGQGAPGGAWSGAPGTTWGAPPTQWPPDWQRQHEAAPNVIRPERAGLVAGVVLIVLGAWFLVDQYVHIDWAVVWPIFVIAAGVALIAGAARRGR
jgi:phage shock protein C